MKTMNVIVMKINIDSFLTTLS